MRIVLLGPPGAGKGTQAAFLRERSGHPHVSTGDLLREAIRMRTDAGRAAEQIVNAGRLVPDPVVREIVRERLGRADAQAGFILDGYPRNPEQAQELDDILAALGTRLDRAVELTVPEDELVRRLAGRRTCTSCKAVFHVGFNRPRRDGVCDRCGAALIQREDDQEQVIRERMRVYRESTAPLVQHYRDKGILVSIAAGGDVKEVARKVEAAVRGGA